MPQSNSCVVIPRTAALAAFAQQGCQSYHSPGSNLAQDCPDALIYTQTVSLAEDHAAASEVAANVLEQETQCGCLCPDPAAATSGVPGEQDASHSNERGAYDPHALRDDQEREAAIQAASNALLHAVERAQPTGLLVERLRQHIAAAETLQLPSKALQTARSELRRLAAKVACVPLMRAAAAGDCNMLEIAMQRIDPRLHKEETVQNGLERARADLCTLRTAALRAVAADAELRGESAGLRVMLVKAERSFVSDADLNDARAVLARVEAVEAEKEDRQQLARRALAAAREASSLVSALMLDEAHELPVEERRGYVEALCTHHAQRVQACLGSAAEEAGALLHRCAAAAAAAADCAAVHADACKPALLRMLRALVQRARSEAEELDAEAARREERRRARAPEPGERPNEHFCPITLELMRDPTTAADGYNYERWAIEKHLLTSSSSPRDARVPLGSTRLVSNVPLRLLIREWPAQQHAFCMRVAALMDERAAESERKRQIAGDVLPQSAPPCRAMESAEPAMAISGDGERREGDEKETERQGHVASAQNCAGHTAGDVKGADPRSTDVAMAASLVVVPQPNTTIVDSSALALRAPQPQPSPVARRQSSRKRAAAIGSARDGAVIPVDATADAAADFAGFVAAHAALEVSTDVAQGPLAPAVENVAAASLRLLGGRRRCVGGADADELVSSRGASCVTTSTTSCKAAQPLHQTRSTLDAAAESKRRRKHA